METSLIVSSLLQWVIVIFNLFLTFALVRRLNNASPRSKLDPPSRRNRPGFYCAKLTWRDRHTLHVCGKESGLCVHLCPLRSLP